MTSRKRTKKERKAEAAAQAAAQAERERPWWMTVAGWGEDRACCNHGCRIVPAVVHPVSRFMGEIMPKSSIFYAADKVLQHHRDVWADATHREIQMAIRIMVTMGTNLILNDLYLEIDRNCAIQSQRNCAHYILQLEQ